MRRLPGGVTESAGYGMMFLPFRREELASERKNWFKEVLFYMDKKAINEIRKLFDKNDCRVDRMYGCYVNEQKERIADLKDSFHSLQDEELFKYCEIFKKAVSGKIGRTLFNMEFPLSEEKEGGHQPELYELLKSGLKDEEMVDRFFDRIISVYRCPEKYLILLGTDLGRHRNVRCVNGRL